MNALCIFLRNISYYLSNSVLVNAVKTFIRMYISMIPRKEDEEKQKQHAWLYTALKIKMINYEQRF